MKTATILAILALILPSAGASISYAIQKAGSAHESSRTGISTLTMVSNINQDIRDLDKRCATLNMLIERKRSDLLRVELSPNQDSRLIELKSRLQNEIEDYQRLLEQHLERLRDKEMQESKLLERLSTA